ncbi:NUDIX domain-containing protein [Nocardioides marmorisolisilvae]|uniref:NUDIX hydrolase n=1 Tax=Nocardioides marmorisolisilvae TaxID=1542737 RepID=A0A3N0DUS2_9ACTN|nr:NUDIX hydrolase [Nocardioides marmorisolisilvae]RNL79281.1 NUDIX hydrolase [Nocardioides marmorisolisilvae]
MSEAGAELRDEPLSWPVASTRDIHRDDWVVAVRKDTISRPGHPEEEFGRIVVEDPGAVVILAIDDQDRVVVVRQYRHPAQMRLVELPAGKLDQPGEDPLVAARRELLEEAGLEAAVWTHLMTTWASPGITSETHAMYLATGLQEVDSGYEPHHEEAEMILERVPRAELIEAVLDGRVADAPLITAILAHETLLARGRL